MEEKRPFQQHACVVRWGARSVRWRAARDRSTSLARWTWIRRRGDDQMRSAVMWRSTVDEAMRGTLHLSSTHIRPSLSYNQW